MNRIVNIIVGIGLLLMIPLSVSAQPRARQSQQAQQKQQAGQTLTTRAQISFPTSAAMSEDVVWRRDIYRELDLNEDANAGLYYPVEPIGSQMNLFTYIFKLMMTGQVRCYEYRITTISSMRRQPTAVSGWTIPTSLRAR